MDKLISISEHSDYLDSKFKNCINKWLRHRKRVEFGKQKLEIWMFVPCKLVDNVWVVLEEPKENEYCLGDIHAGYFRQDLKEYQESKERVLFEGFEFKGETDFTWIFNHNGNFPIMIPKNRSVEYLSIYLKIEITLTQTAKKQI